ncbi:restriction endonuclease subunit S [Selenomonas sp. CM52]|uniref:restriction endonuclease subunit S n=1 Tax=Selenomonas sp. CM52 TaxID=936381 RepID=UPI00027C3928|nr:restriction endonuclease subunit S [Selenomonas sp. CM52]EJU30460.1 type I restriction modification DNA specificity domain protein [Selenomonas sp. CM52]
MSRLRELMEELCPDGVEYRKLGEIATNVFRGSGIKRDEVKEKGTPCVRYGEIYTTYGIWFDACISHTDETVVANPKYFEHGDILFAITGENVEEIAKSTAYIGYDRCLAGGDIVVLQHKQNPKYLSYVLSTEMAQRQKSKGRVKSKVVHSSVPAIKGIEIPVPPLEIQNEIVKLLDSFTELTTELTLRKKQYNFYRDSLLNFVRVDDIGVIHIRLSEIAEIGTGSSNTNEGLSAGMFPFFVRSQEVRWKNSYEYDETAIITSGDGVGVGKIFHYIEGKYALHQRAYRIHIIDGRILPRFLFYYMKTTFYRYITQNAVQSSVVSIRRPMLDKYSIPVPPLDVQKKIVSILDRFDALCNDLTSGLPAEIVARKKQYEYYRDKLLTFPRSKREERS